MNVFDRRAVLAEDSVFKFRGQRVKHRVQSGRVEGVEKSLELVPVNYAIIVI